MPRSRPYGANAQLKEWADSRGLRYSSTAHCLHWVSTGRCGVGHCREDRTTFQWMDHISGWIDGDGNRLLICQPYEISNFLSLHEACQKFGLRARVNGDGWYGHGTVCIELKAAS